MKELLTIEITDTFPIIRGRELHEALGVKFDYEYWFNFITKNEFVKGYDYSQCFTDYKGITKEEKEKLDHFFTLEMVQTVCETQQKLSRPALILKQISTFYEENFLK